MIRMGVADLMRIWRPGSADHDWNAEALTLMDPKTMNLMFSMIDDGRKVRDPKRGEDPVLLGDDGRVWDGHHRIIAAWLVDAPDLPVAFGEGG